ncbi:hypothetical protein DFQ30_005598, partial [Apophysomyces sp. BC1015]
LRSALAARLGRRQPADRVQPGPGGRAVGRNRPALSDCPSGALKLALGSAERIHSMKPTPMKNQWFARVAGDAAAFDFANEDHVITFVVAAAVVAFEPGMPLSPASCATPANRSPLSVAKRRHSSNCDAASTLMT